MSSAPLLADVTIDGKPRKIVAVPSKQSCLYVFDRITGQPIWPIPETPVPQSDVPGEKTAPTQPIPSKPPAYARPFVKVPDDIMDFTPDLRAQAMDQLKWFVVNPTPYNPPIVSTLEGKIAALTIGTLNGGTNWPGSTLDPELHSVFAPACNSCLAPLGLVKPAEEVSDIDYIMGDRRLDVRASFQAGGEGDAADAPAAGVGRAPGPERRPPPPPPAAAAAPAGWLPAVRTRTCRAFRS